MSPVSNRLVLALTVVLAILGGLAAAAETRDPVNFEGRWKAQDRDIVFDIRACGEKICGQLVTSGSGCGAIVLTIAVASEREVSGEPIYVGDLNLPSERAYKVRVAASGSPARMHIMGGDRVPSLFQRSFPMHLVLSRIGDSSCPPRATS